MIDIKLIREEKELVKENIKKKFQDEKLPLVDEIYELDMKYRNTKKEADDLRNKKNKLSDQIGIMMREGKLEEAKKIKEEVGAISFKIANLEAEEEKLENKIKSKLNVDSFVEIDNNQINVIAISKNHDVKLANNIMRTVQEEYKEKVYVTVNFK